MFVHPAGNELNNVSDLDPKCIQMNAVDIRVSELRLIDDYEHPYSDHHNQLFEISDEQTVHKKKSHPIPVNDDGSWVLTRGAYEFTSPHFVTVPSGYCGYLITRSSLNRNGIFIISGLYDSGFEGFVGGTLYNFGGRIKMQHNVRLCQLVMATAETLKMYEGQYNFKKIHSEELIGSLHSGLANDTVNTSKGV
jgi:deoxycytidine triphosphate deaminase